MMWLMVMDFICEVAYVPCDYLKFASVDRGSCTVRIDGDIPWVPLELKRGKAAALDVQSALKDGTRWYTAKLDAVLLHEAQLPGMPVAFRLKTLDGRFILMGAYARPFPTVKTRRTFAERFSDAPASRISVEWVALFPPLFVVS